MHLPLWWGTCLVLDANAGTLSFLQLVPLLLVLGIEKTFILLKLFLQIVVLALSLISGPGHFSYPKYKC